MNTLPHSFANDPLIKRCKQMCRESQLVLVETEQRLEEYRAVIEAARRNRLEYSRWVIRQSHFPASG